MNSTNKLITLKSGRKLSYAEYGEPMGYPIIYCHGSQSSKLEMHYDLAFAIENKLRIIVIDRPGHGDSQFNPEGTILSFAADVKELADQLNIKKLSVAGMSAGSPFALAIAYMFPQLVCRVSIISGFAPYNNQSKKFLSKEVKLMLNLAKNFPFLLRILLKFQAKNLKNNPKKSLQGFLKIMSEPDQQILKNKSVMLVMEKMFVEAFKNGSKGVAHEISKLLVKDWGFELNKIKTPVTFWQGKKDNNVPYKWAELMQSEIENSEIKILAEEGHLIIFEHAQAIFSQLKE